MATENQNLFQNIRQKRSTNEPYQAMRAEITFFKVDAVNEVGRTIDIRFIHSSVKETDVPYISPFISASCGIDFVPSVGDIGIVAMTSVNGRIVIGFLAGQNRSSGLPLQPGDIMTKSGQLSVIKQDKSGNILISTDGGSSIYLDKEGGLFFTSKDEATTSDFRETYTGRTTGGSPTSQEVYYEKALSEDMGIVGVSSEDVVNALMNDEETLMEGTRSPVLRISKIKKISGEIVEVLETTVTNEEIRYEIEVLDPDDEEQLSAITFDGKGNIRIKAKHLIYDVDDITYE